jgi:hypothetical protein
MRAVSTLRLSERERELFLAALKAYGYEDGASFLRAAARALIAHHRAGDSLEPLISFRLQQHRVRPERFRG